MMMSMYSSASYGSETTASTTTELDKDRYYRCSLTGPDAPEAAGMRPTLKLTFSVPME